MQYWLMKSEPSVFNIDDLANCAKQTDFWDGVRNYQVRNWLRDTMRIGDQAFFYYSSCPHPGIAGVIEIVSEGYPDSTAFNSTHHHYDKDSHPTKLRWYGVDVRLVLKFKQLILLEQLKAQPDLRKMRVLQKGNRLSITPVTPQEWCIIMNLGKNTSA